MPETSFRIVGYVTDWDGIVSQIPFERLTHINYAFLIPEDDGSLQSIANGWKLEDIVEQAHAQGVKVLISVGGWGYDEQFETFAADPTARARFVEGVVRFVEQYQLDGVDIDWEYPDPGPSSQNYLALMRELRAALPDRLLTAAVIPASDTAEGIVAEVFDLVDFLNLMVYDGSSTDHSPYSLAVEALDYWSERGLPAEKTVLGVPFYSRPGEVSYARLVENDPVAAEVDAIDYKGLMQYYNGIPTMVKKTQLAMERASGIMIWTVTYDAPGDASLVEAIYRTAQGK